ncbi:cytochrome P460 family protein [Shewanella olleyana]|uniref:cytochrome P460 family protein n=1 Tax=Shewanella olleyana TaxID=135626 RepID=UPI00200DCA8F|nr:cytochrome P460 family protein [Shewanella olleyana]MCL1067944.1 cytochrome P460 family protein [Shewanella olleyana]
MKKCKVALLSIGVLIIFPVLFIQAKTSNSGSPYQINIFGFDHTLVPQSENYQSNWRRLTGFEHSGLHWEQFVVIYTNKGEQVYRHNFLQYSAWFDDPEDEDNQPIYKMYPTGTTFIKENYHMKQGKPSDAESITVMIKRQIGFNPAGGDWEYMQFSKNGEQIIKGKGSDKLVQQKCASCHENVSERDFIFSNFYSGTSHQ